MIIIFGLKLEKMYVDVINGFLHDVIVAGSSFMLYVMEILMSSCNAYFSFARKNARVMMYLCIVKINF